mgnify:CR=1 FL=1
MQVSEFLTNHHNLPPRGILLQCGRLEKTITKSMVAWIVLTIGL